jgi:hypothetical protein
MAHSSWEILYNNNWKLNQYVMWMVKVIEKPKENNKDRYNRGAQLNLWRYTVHYLNQWYFTFKNMENKEIFIIPLHDSYDYINTKGN